MANLQSTGTRQPNVWKCHVWALAIILFLVLVAFYPGLKNGFVGWDDPTNLLGNPHYRGLGWSQLRWMLTTTFVGVYQPLGWMLFGAVYIFFGDGPRGFHLVALGLHAATTVAVYVLLLQLIKYPSTSARSTVSQVFAAGVGTMFFAIHPLRVECVAWASALPYLLAGLLAVTSVIVYIRAAQTSSGGLYFASLALYALSLASKAIAVPLPLALVILDIYLMCRFSGGILGKSNRFVWLQKLPYVILAITFAAMAVKAGSSDPRTPDLGPAEMAFLPARVLAIHCLKTIAPLDLSPVYELPCQVGIGQWRYGLSCTFVLGITLVALFTRRRFGIFWPLWLAFVVMMAPYLRFVPHTPFLTADRYSYLPAMVWSGLIAYGVLWAFLKGQARIAVLAALAVSIVLVQMTRQQVLVWRDSNSLWEYAHLVDPGSLESTLGLARVYLADDRYAEAIPLAQKVLANRPGDGSAHRILARSSLHQDELDDALFHVKQALQSSVRDGFGQLLLAEVHTARTETEEATKVLLGLAAVPPDNLAVLNFLGIALSEGGLGRESNGVFEHAMRLGPNERATLRNFGAALMRDQEFDRAAEIFGRLRFLDPDDADAALYEAEARVQLADYTGAAQGFQRAQDLAPDNLRVMLSYSWLLSSCPDAEIRNCKTALVLAQRAALRSRHSGLQVVDCLGAAWACNGRFEEAVAHAAEAHGMARDAGWHELADDILLRQHAYEAGQALTALPRYAAPRAQVAPGSGDSPIS